MKPAIQTLGQILYSPSQYIIPVFQRNYRWDKPQWNKLWESLTEIQKPDKVGNHFMGFLVFIPELAQPGKYNRFHIIDGQQRITTLSLILIAIRNIAKTRGINDLADEIHTYYLIHPIKKGEDKYRLLPKERENENYIALIEQTDRPDSRILQGTRFFESKISEFCGENPEKLKSFFNTVSQRLEFLCATLENEDAYNIFKSLNSTGVPLSQPDLVRNYIFMHVRPEDSFAFDKNQWSKLEEDFTLSDGKLDDNKFSQFLRDFLISIRSTYHKPHETFFVFEARYEATDFLPVQLTETLRRYSNYYSIISSVNNDVSTKVTTWLKHLNELFITTTYPLLLSLFEYRNSGMIDSDDLANAIRILTSFILRRFICNESSRGYGQMFIKNLGVNSTPINDLQEYLSARGWPDDERFINAFIRTPLYTRGYKEYILKSLEKNRKHREQADLSITQVEHIMPQTLSEGWKNDLGDDFQRVHNEWLNTPGNLTLSAYNQELWNFTFDKKKMIYNESNIGITREIATNTTWGEEQIKNRGHQLAEEAAKLWIGPDK